MVVGIDRQHGVALHHLAGCAIDPGIPQAGKPPRLPIEGTESPPDIRPRLPARFIERQRRDDAALAIAPGIAEGWLARGFL